MTRPAGEIGRETPLRLQVALDMAFPDGTVSIAMARKAIADGTLVAWIIGGRYLTTIAELHRMLDQCRAPPKAHVSSTDAQNGPRRRGRPRLVDGSSETAPHTSGRALAKAKLRQLSERLPTTSRTSTKSPGDNVVSGKFR